MPVKHVAFTMYPVSDLPRAVAFYTDVLGLKQDGLASDFWAEFDVAGQCFGLGSFEQVGQPGSAQSLALEIEDLASFRTKLAGQGCESTEPHQFPGCMISVVRDPDGNQIWLHQTKN